MNMDKLIKGNQKFKDVHFPKLEDKFDPNARKIILN